MKFSQIFFSFFFFFFLLLLFCFNCLACEHFMHANIRPIYVTGIDWCYNSSGLIKKAGKTSFQNNNSRDLYFKFRRNWLNYRLCQKKLYNLVLNIKNICRIIYPSHFTVWIVRFFSCNLFFVSFKLDILKLRYCHLSEAINFLLGPVQWITVLDTLTWTALMESNNRQTR